MSADKVQEAYTKALVYRADDVLDCEMRDVLDALIAAVREDEREKAVARFLAMGPWTEESGAGIVEAIRNA